MMGDEALLHLNNQQRTKKNIYIKRKKKKVDRRFQEGKSVYSFKHSLTCMLVYCWAQEDRLFLEALIKMFLWDFT